MTHLKYYLIRDVNEANITYVHIFEPYARVYTPADIEAGGIQSEDRHGALRFYGFVSLAAGVVSVSSNSQLDSDAIATLAASAKREAKKAADNFYICSCNPLDVNCFS